MILNINFTVCAKNKYKINFKNRFAHNRPNKTKIKSDNQTEYICAIRIIQTCAFHISCPCHDSKLYIIYIMRLYSILCPADFWGFQKRT